MVHFVGAGSGAADLITVRGAKLLGEADVVIYAGSLVNPAVLDYTKAGCEIHDSAKLTLEEVIALIERAEREGKTTVRLHTGDPSIYGAVREQFDALTERGIDFDVCPGVSSFCGAAAALDVLKKTNLAQTAFGGGFGESAGAMFVAVCLFFFAFSTILGWNFFGRINVEYLFGKKAVPVYSIIAVALIFLGSCVSNDLAWELSDMFNQLMVIPNFLAIVALGGLVAAAARKGSRETLKK